MNNPESVLENGKHKIFCDFEIQTEYIISGKRLDLAIVNTQKKETLLNC